MRGRCLTGGLVDCGIFLVKKEEEKIRLKVVELVGEGLLSTGLPRLVNEHLA